MERKFKVGDKVRLKHGRTWEYGGQAAIRAMQRAAEDRTVLVVERVASQHMHFPVIVRVARGVGLDDCLGFSEDELELIEPAVPAFKHGDQVELTERINGYAIGTRGRVHIMSNGELVFECHTGTFWIREGQFKLIGEPHVPVCPQPEPRPDAVRIQELIEANNALVERERAAKKELAFVRSINENLVIALQNRTDRDLAADKAHAEITAELRETIQNLQHENSAQAALLERAERQDTSNMPKTGMVLWITNGGTPHRFDPDEGAWTPCTLRINEVQTA